MAIHKDIHTNAQREPGTTVKTNVKICVPGLCVCVTSTDAVWIIMDGDSVTHDHVTESG